MRGPTRLPRERAAARSSDAAKKLRALKALAPDLTEDERRQHVIFLRREFELFEAEFLASQGLFEYGADPRERVLNDLGQVAHRMAEPHL